MQASKIGYYWNKELANRKTGLLCPEVPERCLALAPDQVFSNSKTPKIYSFESRSEEILELVHTPKYIDNVKTAFARSKRALDSGDTRVTEDTFDQALLSASAALDATDAIIRGEINTAFCAVRPPGHHANAMRALGFCIFNNVAIASRYAQRTYNKERVLIIDWDVHPGNGTQEIFWEDPSVFTLSFHARGFLGESGDEQHIGAAAGIGFNRNVPFDSGTTPAEYQKVFRERLSEVADSFKPNWILIAAGFDAHVRDPSKGLSLEEKDYFQLTNEVLAIARQYCGGKLLSVLEGGYDIPALRDSVAEHCRALVESD